MSAPRIRSRCKTTATLTECLGLHPEMLLLGCSSFSPSGLISSTSSNVMFSVRHGISFSSLQTFAFPFPSAYTDTNLKIRLRVKAKYRDRGNQNMHNIVIELSPIGRKLAGNT
jgi:hypothetical protein